MSQVKTGVTFMIKEKLWHILTQTFPQSIARLGRSIFTIWTQREEAKKTALSSVSHLSQDARSYFISCFRMGRSTIDCLSQLFSKNIFKEPKCQICRSTSYSCGTVLVIGLVCIALIGWLV